MSLVGVEMTDFGDSTSRNDDPDQGLVQYIPPTVGCDNWWKLAPRCCECWNCFPVQHCRKAVSQKKRRFKEDGFNLDLTYLTPRIVIFGWPAIGLEHCFRNPRSEVVRFFEERHKDRYFIYNFCCETGRAYDPAIFAGRVQVYPFQDHCIPTPAMISNFCDSAARWLAADPKNVIGVHCKAGKGRSGMMACCLFQKLGLAPTAAAAISLYNSARTKNNKGLTVPSQRRYVAYYEEMRAREARGEPFEEPTLGLESVTLSHPAASGPAVLTIFQGQNRDTGNIKYRSRLTDRRVFTPNIKLRGNCLLEYKQGGTKLKLDVWFNTAFVEGEELVIEKLGVDKLKKDFDHHKMPADFTITFKFKPRKKTVYQTAAAVLSLQDHTHTQYCDRKHAVCRAPGRFVEGETVTATMRSGAAVERVYWYRSVPGDSETKGEAEAADVTVTTAVAATTTTAARAGAGAGVGAGAGAGAGAVPDTDDGVPTTVTDHTGRSYTRVEKATDSRLVTGVLPTRIVEAADTELSAGTNGAAVFAASVAAAEADAGRYMLGRDDIGHQLVALVKAAGDDSLHQTPPTQEAVAAAPPKAREVWIQGEAVVGSVLRAGSWYFGGVQGATTYSWVRVSADGARTETPAQAVDVSVPFPPATPDAAADPRCYLLTAADLGAAIKVKVTAVRADGTAGYPTTSKPTSVVKAADAAAADAAEAASDLTAAVSEGDADAVDHDADAATAAADDASP